MTTASNIKNRYSLVEHTADTGISLIADSLPELFELAGIALFDILIDLKDVSPVKTWKVQASADDLPQLMVKWLSELLYLHEVKGLVAVEINVKEISGTSLTADVRGDEFDPEKHVSIEMMKAITYHKLDVSKTPDGKYQAYVIFDV